MVTSTANTTHPILIAPCGIDCRLCRAFVRVRQACPGCRGGDTNKARSCVTCRIKNCEKLAAGKLVYCFDCDEFPCALITRLDKRYRTRYATSPIENLLNIRDHGIQAFITDENRKWTCPRCGVMLCMHKPQCLSCGFDWQT